MHTSVCILTKQTDHLTRIDSCKITCATSSLFPNNSTDIRREFIYFEYLSIKSHDKQTAIYSITYSQDNVFEVVFDCSFQLDIYGTAQPIRCQLQEPQEQFDCVHLEKLCHTCNISLFSMCTLILI